LLVNLAILALPLGGIAVLRLYESALVRQTESELIAQSAFVSAAYKTVLRRAYPNLANRYGHPVATAHAARPSSTDRWQPRPAHLDLAADPVLPKPEPGIAPTAAADVYARRSGNEITAFMRDAQSVTLAAIRVMNPDGVVVATTGEELGLSLAGREEVARALRGEHVSVLRQRVSDEPDPGLASISRSTGVRVFVAMPIVENDRVLGAVLAARTPANIVQTLYRQRETLFFGMLAVLTVVFAVSLFTAVTIARPVKAVIRQTDRAVRGEKGAVIPLSRPVTREVAQLSEAVAQLARTLEDRADYIRDFAAHVSHEFKTPLTAMQGAVELLEEHGAGMTPAERDRFHANLRANIARLDRLVRKLLDLARADMTKPGKDLAQVTPVLERTIQRYRDQGCDIDLDAPAASTTVRFAEETLESVVSNMIENALQHGGAQVAVRVHATTADDFLVLRIEDDGPGVSGTNRVEIFEPFFTTARDRGGTGIGLAVVKSLLAAHHGGISLIPSQRGAVFEIRLPLQA
jgi:signal transduction histidine kinase